MQKILTVVVPAYNVEAYLRKNMDSYGLSGIKDEVEILVIDDGSTDRTGEIAEEYARRYPETVRVFHKENGGHGSGINLGIDKARGSYFKVVDADDWVDTEEFGRFLNTLREQVASSKKGTGSHESAADIVYSGFKWAIQRPNGSDRFRYKSHGQVPFHGARYGKTYCFDKVAHRLYIRMHNMTIRTAILQEHNILLDEKCFYVDLEYITYPIPWVKTVCFTDTNVYRYRMGRSGQSVEIGQMRKNERDYDRVAASLLRFYRKLSGEIMCTPDRKAYVCKVISKYIGGKIKIILSYPISKEKKTQLIQLDRYLKTRYYEIYTGNQNMAVTILRKSGYLMYCPASMLVKWKYRKK